MTQIACFAIELFLLSVGRCIGYTWCLRRRMFIGI
jgi:hypothetical protein